MYGEPLPDLVYLPCAGTPRHAAPLLVEGARQVVAVDLSELSLTAGLGRDVPAGLRGHVTSGSRTRWPYQVGDLGMMGEPDCWYRAVRP